MVRKLTKREMFLSYESHLDCERERARVTVVQAAMWWRKVMLEPMHTEPTRLTARWQLEDAIDALLKLKLGVGA